jgi:ATP:ADP antiporter, AAA family
MRFLESFHDVRAEERRGALAAFLTLFGILAGHTLLETARDALFLARLPASQLPWVYLAMAAAAVVIAPGPRSGAWLFGGSRALSALLLVCAVLTAGFWAVGSWSHPWALRGLYVFTGLVGTLTALQFWLVVGEMYTITQAKRLYKVIGLGSLLGAVAGAGAARVVSMHIGASHLILASAIAFALTACGPAMLLRRVPTAGGAREASRSLAHQVAEMLRGDPYVKRLAGLVLISTVALTLADYVFKSTVARRVPAAELGAFFATFYMVLNGLALVAQLVLTGWLLRVAGLHRALWVLPTLLFLGASGVAFGGGLLAALWLKGADGTLRHSLHRTGTELLFLPIPDAIRPRVKPLIDVLGQRGGQALASIFILAEVSQNRGEVVLATAAAVLCFVWIGWSAELRPHYIDLFRNALRQGTMHRRIDAPDLDLGSLEALFAALNSRDDAEVVAALDLLGEEGRVRLIPALILYHPSPAVVLRALSLFAGSGRTDFVPVADRLLGHADHEVRAAALRSRSAVAPDQAILLRAASDESPLVRATALVGTVAGGWVTDEAQATLDDLMASRSPESRRALAAALRQHPLAEFSDMLLELSHDPDEEVQRDVAEAMGVLRDLRFLPALLPLLVPHEVRTSARGALLAFGEEGLDFLDQALGDTGLPHDIRRHLPRSISRFPGELAAPILLRHLIEEPDGMVRFKIIRGLGRLAANHPEVELDGAVLQRATDLTLETAFRLVHWRLVLSRGREERHTPGQELLVSLVRDKEVHAVERLFRLLGLQFRPENLEQIYRGLKSSNPKVRASSREILESFLPARLRDAVLALVDDAPGAQRLARAAPFYRPEPLDYEGLLERMLDYPGETLRCIAAHHVGEIGLQSLRPRLEAFQVQQTGFFLARVIERALQALEQPPKGLAHAG